MRLKDIFEDASSYPVWIMDDPSVSDSDRRSVERTVLSCARLFAKHGIHNLTNCYVQIIGVSHVIAPNGAPAAALYIPSQDIVQIDPTQVFGNMHDFTVVHEFGHRFDFVASRQWDFRSQTTNMYNYCRSEPSTFPRSYSASNVLEFWADCFAYHLLGRQMNPELKTWTREMIDKYASHTEF
jgi:hypothetical protein